MYQNVKRTCRACRAIVFADQTYCFVASSLPSASSFRKLPVVCDDASDLKGRTMEQIVGE